MKIRKALYAGSFDPFTNGHLSIVEKSVELFDEVIVGIAGNSKKQRSTDIHLMKNAITKTLNMYNNVTVVTIHTLVAQYCKVNGIHYLIRGLRNTSDYLYEENISKINNKINPILDTIYFRAVDDTVSSSMVRELKSYGVDISKFVPEEIYKIL